MTKIKPHLSKYLTGKWVKIREISADDNEDVVNWRNDAELGKYLQTYEKLTVESQGRYLEHYFRKPDDFSFILETVERKTKFGTVAIYNVDFSRQRAEFGRLLVLPEYRPYAFEAAFLALRCFFEGLNGRLLYGYAFAENEGVISFDLGLGLKKIERVREYFKNPVTHESFDAQYVEMGWDDYLKTRELYGKLLRHSR